MDPAYASTRVFSFCPGRKVTTRRAEMGISSPVLGFLPGRSFLSLRSKLPKPESFTWCPLARAPRTSSKKDSTISLASRLLRPSSSNSLSAMTALVSAILPSQSATELALKGQHDTAQDGVHLFIRQGFVRCLER